MNNGIFLCCLLFLLSGCWDRVEINELAIVLATGIEKSADDTIQLSVQIKTPSSPGAGNPPIKIKQGKGKTIKDAMQQLQEKTPRKIFWSHNEAVFISEELARNGIVDYVDFLARYVEARLRSHIFITKEKMSDLMDVQPVLGSSAGEITKEIAHFESGLNVDIRKLLVMITSDTNTAAIPWLELVEDPDQDTGYMVNGIAMFKNNKMVGYIDDELTRGVLWARDEIDTASVTIQPNADKKDYISFDLIRASTRVIPTYKNGKWKILLKMKTEDDVTENQTNLNVMDPSTRKDLEKKLEERVEKRIKSMLEIVQKDLSIDILKFGEAIHQKYPKKWNEIKHQWEEIFQELEIEMEVNAIIERPGSSSKSLEQQNPEEREN